MILGSYLGVHLGYWTVYQLGIVTDPPSPPPYPILWPSYAQYGHTLLRMTVGGVTLMATRAVVKPLSYLAACYVMGENMDELKRQTNDIKNKNKIRAELTYKFVTYVVIGFNSIVVTPILFEVMGIARSTYYTEL